MYFGFDRPYIDTSGGDTEIGAFVAVSEFDEIASASMRIDGPGGPWRSVELAGDAEPGRRVQASIPVPSSTPAGDYRITYLRVVYADGDTRTFDGFVPPIEAGGRTEFEVYHGPDTEGPELTGFSFSPLEVDTGAGPGSIAFSIEAADALSGVKWVAGTIALPNWEPSPVQLGSACGGEIPPDEGTRHAGTWLHNEPLVEHAMPGRYQLLGLYLCDLAGNTSSYTKEELEQLGYPTEFVETGPGDTTPPEILGFSLEPATLHAAAGEATVQFYTHVRDADTGIGEWPDKFNSDVLVFFEHPGYVPIFSTTSEAPRLISGTILDGIWRQPVTLEKDTPVGRYTIDQITATDRAGNTTTLKGLALEAQGWDLSFENLP